MGGKKYLTVLKFLIQWVINCYCQHVKMTFSGNFQCHHHQLYTFWSQLADITH